MKPLVITKLLRDLNQDSNVLIVWLLFKVIYCSAIWFITLREFMLIAVLYFKDCRSLCSKTVIFTPNHHKHCSLEQIANKLLFFRHNTNTFQKNNTVVLKNNQAILSLAGFEVVYWGFACYSLQSSIQLFAFYL